MKNADKPIYPLQSDGFPSSERVAETGGFLIGLTKREAFAMAAMQGILASLPGVGQISEGLAETIAHEALIVAEKMCERLEPNYSDDDDED